MSDVTALIVHIIQVKNNFVYLNSKLLDKFQNSKNNLICIEIKVNQECNYGSCSIAPFNFNGENAFNISAAFAQTLNVNEYDTVIISKIDSVISLKTVYVTAMSADDLQILECSTEAIQSTLLNQIRIVRIHQILSVWISKSFTLKIHIDQLNDGVIYGKLEQYTEVIVSLDVKVCTNCSPTDTENKYNPEMPLNSPWNYLKDMFSLRWKRKNSTVKSTYKNNETSFISSGVFRCMPFKNNFKHQLIQYPYNAFIARKYCSYTNSYVREGSYFLCRLTYIPYTSTKTEKKMQSLNEDIASVTELFGHEIYIHLYIIEDTDVTDSSFLMMNSYPTIFVSQAVQYFFNLKINSKVKLDLIHNENKQRLTEIDYIFIKKASLEEKTIDNVKLHFQTCVQNSPKLIVNNYCLFTLDTFALNVLYLTFNPANLPYVELSKEDIDHCDFRLVQRKIDVKLEDDTNDPTMKMTEYTTPLSFQQVIVRKLKTTLLLKLRLLKSSCISHLENNNHILIEGDAGTSKSNIIAFVCDEMSKSSFGIFTKILDCKSLKGKLVSKMEKILEAALNECVYYQPAILCFDDLDVLFTSSKQNSQQVEPSVSSYFNRLSHMIHDSFRSRSGHHITVLATVSSTSNLEPCLFQARGSSLFSSSLPIPALNQDMRQEAFVRLLSSKVNFNTTSIIQNLEYMCTVVQRLENYCIQDIKDLVDRICFEAVKGRVDIDRKLDVFEVCKADVDRAIQETVPLSLIDIELRKDTTVSWKDVGGLTAAKKLLTEILIWPSQFPKIFEQCPLKMPSGVLLYGVPGSGKTLLASAVAGESRLNFISIKGPELLSKFVGESEEGIRNTFRKAQNAKPCILFFDEFDSLAPRRGNDITGVTDRVVNQLLTELDGVESVSGVWVLAATSRPDLIDPALLRPGRLGSMVHCPLPNQVERCSILEIICSSIDLRNDIDFNAVACITEGYTGADLRAVLYTAVVTNDQSRLSIIRSHLESRDELKEFPSSPTVMKNVDTQYLIEAVHKTKPSLKLDERLAYERIYKRFLEREEKFEAPLENQRLTYA